MRKICQKKMSRMLTLCGFGLGALLVACSGGGSSGTMGALDGGHGAAGPVDMSAPPTVNKGLVSCENITGPEVECRGSNGSAPPNSHVLVSVEKSGSSSSASFLKNLVLRDAHAETGATALCPVSGTGSFGIAGDCRVIAAQNDDVAICITASGKACSGPKLVLKIGAEGTTTSGDTGTMKNLVIDPNTGDGFHSKNDCQKPMEARGWNLLDWLIPSAHAELATQYPVANSTCTGQDVDWQSLPSATNTEAQCHIMRVSAANPEASESFIDIPTCANGQNSIQKIEQFVETNTGRRHLAVAVDHWVYFIDINPSGDNANPAAPVITRRIAFPYEVQDITVTDQWLMFLLGGEDIPKQAQRLYFMKNESGHSWAASCEIAGFPLQGNEALHGLKRIVDSDTFGSRTFILVGEFEKGDGVEYRILQSRLEDFDGAIIGAQLYPVLTHPREIEVSSLGFIQMWDKWFTFLVGLDKGTKEVLMIRYEAKYQGVENVVMANTPLSGILVNGAPLQVGEVRNLSIDRDRREIAFFNDLSDNESQLVVLTYGPYPYIGWRVNAEAMVTSLDYTPSALTTVNVNANAGWVVNDSNNGVETITPGTAQVNLQKVDPPLIQENIEPQAIQ